MQATDHVIGAQHANREPPLSGPYTEHDAFHDPFTLFSFLAAITKLEFATGVMILPQRQTALVAKQAADLDQLSDQRFRLCVGTGWNYVEYEALGMPFANRGKRFDEQITFLRKLWSEPLLTFHGEFEHIERGNINIRPKRPIPLWLGGHTEPAFRRAARVADGFVITGTDKTAHEQWLRIAELLKEQGRSEGEFGRELMIMSRSNDPVKHADQIKRWRDLGHTHACFDTAQRGFQGVDQHLDFVAAVKRNIDAG
jgi:probable F420-dependent oxidoreductase